MGSVKLGIIKPFEPSLFEPFELRPFEVFRVISSHFEHFEPGFLGLSGTIF